MKKFEFERIVLDKFKKLEINPYVLSTICGGLMALDTNCSTGTGAGYRDYADQHKYITYEYDTNSTVDTSNNGQLFTWTPMGVIVKNC